MATRTLVYYYNDIPKERFIYVYNHHNVYYIVYNTII